MRVVKNDGSAGQWHILRYEPQVRHKGREMLHFVQHDNALGTGRQCEWSLHHFFRVNKSESATGSVVYNCVSESFSSKSVGHKEWRMKAARWFTLLGSLALIGTAIFHTTGYAPVLRRLEAAAIPPLLEGVFKALWLMLSVLLLGLAVIALLGRGMGGGGWIVLVCAASTGVSALLALHFIGLFPGFYMLAVVTVLFLVGGWMQCKNAN